MYRVFLVNFNSAAFSSNLTAQPSAFQLQQCCLLFYFNSASSSNSTVQPPLILTVSPILIKTAQLSPLQLQQCCLLFYFNSASICSLRSWLPEV